jgi:hypothetical protein
LKELIRPEVTTDDLQRARRTVQQLADETNTQLKKNVYKNYALFIDTAKEISSLKNEMYTLSNLLTDQQKLIGQLLETSISGDKSHLLTAIEKKEAAAKFRNQEQDEARRLARSQSSAMLVSGTLQSTVSKDLQAVLDKIDGVSGILEPRNRLLLMHGELSELDQNEYKPISSQGAVFAVLLNDCLVLATAFPAVSRFAHKKYKFNAFHELDHIAVINVKDASVKNAFKILMSSATKVFMSESVEAKTRWLEAFELAKKQRRSSLSLQRRDSIMFLSGSTMDTSMTGTLPSSGKTPISPIDRPFSSVLNVYEDSELEDVNEQDAEMLPDWLVDLPEDLDVCIAQRNFEEAVGLVHKVNDHFSLYPKCCDSSMQTDLRLRINNKINDLVDCIANELQISPDRSLQSGPKSARRAVALLNRLGKSSLATRLFLAQRTALLRFCQRQQKIDGATLPYIKRMSTVFFNNLTETCKEFQRAFELNVGSTHSAVEPSTSLVTANNGTSGTSSSASLAPALASLVSWCRQQLLAFVGSFTKHVFTPQVPPSIAAECFYLVRSQCKRLRQSAGLDLLFLLDRELRQGIEKIVNDYRDQLLEAIKLRCFEDKWQPQNHVNKAGINKFVEEMRDSGLGCVVNFVFDECRVQLTYNTSAFARSFLNALADLLKLYTEFSEQMVMDTLLITFRTQLKHYENALRNEKLANERRFVRKNVAFIVETVLGLAEQRFAEQLGYASEGLSSLRQEYLHLKNESNMTVVENGSKTKVMIEFL